MKLSREETSLPAVHTLDHPHDGTVPRPSRNGTKEITKSKKNENAKDQFRRIWEDYTMRRSTVMAVPFGDQG